MKLIETIQSFHRELFTVNFDHAAFQLVRNVLFSEYLYVVPDSDTLKHFSNYEIGYRFFNESLICFIRCKLLNPPADNPRAPLRTLKNDLRFRFQLKAVNAFFNVTDIRTVGSGQVYYFNNRVNAGAGMVISNNVSQTDDGDLKDVAVVIPEESCFGVIDVFSNATMNANYELVTGPAQQLRSPVYQLRFRSLI